MTVSMGAPAYEALNDREKVVALERKVESLEQQLDWVKRPLSGASPRSASSRIAPSNRCSMAW